jgi:uncharacterized protein with HEPN domain
MRPESKSLLLDVLNAVGALRSFTAGRTLADYRTDELLRSAVERKFEIIGEALSVMHKKDPATAAMLPEHRDAISFRNALIHGYSRIDDDVVWGVVTTRLEGLELGVRRLLEGSG